MFYFIFSLWRKNKISPILAASPHHKRNLCVRARAYACLHALRTVCACAHESQLLSLSLSLSVHVAYLFDIFLIATPCCVSL